MNAGRALVGIVLVAVGVLYVLDANGALDAGSTIAAWWPASVIGLGLLHALDRGRITKAASVLVIAGGFLLAITSGFLGSNAWRFVWPVALIVAGAWLVVGWRQRSARQVADVAEVDGLAVLSASRVATRSESFRHASLTAVLGGITLDLTRARPQPEGAVVDVTAVLGGATILVPRGWLVEIRGIPILGGWDDTTDRSGIEAGAPRLVVRGLMVMGGLEVKHAGRWLE